MLHSGIRYAEHTAHTRTKNDPMEYNSTLMHTEIDLAANNHSFAAVTVRTAIVLIMLVLSRLIRSSDINVIILAFWPQLMLFPSLLLLLHNDRLVCFCLVRILVQCLHRDAHTMAVA